MAAPSMADDSQAAASSFTRASMSATWRAYCGSCKTNQNEIKLSRGEERKCTETLALTLATKALMAAPMGLPSTEGTAG